MPLLKFDSGILNQDAARILQRLLDLPVVDAVLEVLVAVAPVPIEGQRSS
jgi:hypothetical protein